MSNLKEALSRKEKTVRHFFVHAYGFMLDEDQMKDLAINISDVWSRFLSETERFY